ncbi:MAG: hypothetical protein JSS78_06195 [Bacteroidetes bacterium]|nr:hypothetical protein [Bacteroidota bacterium]
MGDLARRGGKAAGGVDTSIHKSFGRIEIFDNCIVRISAVVPAIERVVVGSLLRYVIAYLSIAPAAGKDYAYQKNDSDMFHRVYFFINLRW